MILRSPVLAAAFASLALLSAAPVGAQAAAVRPVQVAALGDLSPYKTIAEDALALANKGDIAGAQKRGTDLETAWDQAEDTLRPTDKASWRVVDKAIDRVLSELRATEPKQAGIVAALTDLVATINKGGAA